MSWEEVRKDTNENGSSEGIDFISFKEGSTEIRIVDDEPIARWKHWVPQIKRSIVCPGKGCPICNIIKNAKQNKEVPKYNSSKRYHIHVIDRTDGKLKIMENSKTFFGQLLTLQDNVGKLTSYDLKVIRTGTGKKTQYNIIPMAQTPLTEKDKELLSDRIDLDEYFAAPTNEQIIRLLNGEKPEDVFREEDEGVEEIEVDFTE